MPAAKKFEISTVFRAVDRVSGKVARMQARVARFTRSMRRGLGRVAAATKRVAAGLGQGIRVGAAMATVAVVALGVAINKVADNLDTLAKQSKRLDFPIEELQEWQFAAEQSGVESDVFTKSIDKFSKTLGELKGGYGAMVTGLKKTNPQLLKQLKGTDDVSKAMEIYINAMRETKGASQKAALGTLAFGRAGFKMVTLANTSAEGIAKLREEMRANGVATMEQAEAAERYNDTVNSMKLAGAGLLRDVLTPMLPMLTEGAASVRAWMLANKDLVKGKINDFVRGVITGVKNLVATVKAMRQAWLDAKPIVDIIRDGIRRLWVESKPIIDQLAAVFKGNFDKIKDVVKNVVDTVVAIWAEIAPVIARTLGIVKKVWAAIAPALVGAFNFVKRAVKTLWPVVKGVFGLILSGIEKLLPAINFIAKVIGKVFGALGVILESVVTGIRDTFIALPGFFTSLWESITEVFTTAVNFLMTTGPISWLLAGVALIMQHWAPVGAFFESVWGKVVGAFQAGIDAVMGVVTPLIDDFKEVWRDIMGPVEENVVGVFDEIKIAVIGIWDSIVSAVKSAVGEISKFMEPVTSKFEALIAAKDRLIGEQIGFLGGGDDEETAAAGGGGGALPPIVSKEERIARSIEEKNSKSTLNMRLRDDTGRLEVTDSDLGTGMTLAFTGGFEG